MIWAIAIVGGMYASNVSYTGQFEQEAVCNKAAQELRT